MKQPLYKSLGEFADEDRDFAYFSRFTGDERTEGQEYLFETDERPVLFNHNLKTALNEKIPEILEGSPGTENLPLFVSYNFVKDIFGMSLKNDSGWPTIGTVIPTRTRRSEFIRTQPPVASNSPNGATIGPSERDKLENNLSEVIERIRGGELLQVVVSHRFNIGEFSAPDLLSYMIENDRSRYVYYYKMGNIEIVGSSPESVFVRSGSEITIHPIAGTRNRYSAGDSELISSLRNDSKELCEHRMLVDLARNDLHRISSPGSVKVQANMLAEKFYSVIHLTSIVNGTVRSDATNYDIMSSVFPAGTVSGAPKRRALELIDHYERFDRGVYGGAVGIMGTDTMEMALPIRTAFRKSGEAYVQAGAGIVKDSVPEREVNEMIAKANTIMAGGLVCA